MPNNGFKLFGVQIDVAGDKPGGSSMRKIESLDKPGGSSIRKSKSLDNLESYNPENIAAVEPSGYESDGLIHQSSKSHDRKKGKPWSEEEHRSFLAGLEKLGKGDWKGIATQYVPTRNSSQVASHAQKYFIRLAATEKKRRRSSVFDIPLTDVNQSSQGLQSDKAAESSQAANICAASSMNIGEPKGPASISATVASAERPPISPMRRYGVPDNYHNMFYAPRVSNLSQGYATQAIRPTVAWVPFVTYSSQGSVFLPNIHGALTPSCAEFVAPQSVARLPQKGSSQIGVAPATNDELNLDIRNLKLEN